MKYFPVFVLVALLSLTACRPDEPGPKDDGVDRVEVTLEVPAHFRQPTIPPDNPLTQAKIDLGKALFFEPMLSRDSSVSCASCHLPENAFSDPRRLSLGVENRVGKRQAMALVNLAYQRSFFWDGRASTIEEQVHFPVEDPLEMDFRMIEVAERLTGHSEYEPMFQRAFGRSADSVAIVQAIASFERTLLSVNSKYDQFRMQGNDSTLFSAAEWRGYQLFFTETTGTHAECFHCHNDPNFDDPGGRFLNNGLYRFYDDLGRFDVSQNSYDIGRFKVPTLRNIEYSAPYMHDGSIRTLREVLDTYARGGAGHQNQDVLIINITLTEQEKDDLIAFLKTLSDPDFISNPAFRPE